LVIWARPDFQVKFFEFASFDVQDFSSQEKSCFELGISSIFRPRAVFYPCEAGIVFLLRGGFSFSKRKASCEGSVLAGLDYEPIYLNGLIE
jgi:hypothetical protein